MASITEHVSKLNDKDQVTAYKAQEAIQLACYAAMSPAKRTERAELAAAIAGEFQAKGPDNKPEPKYDVRTRNLLLNYLVYVGTDAEVPVLAEAMKELDFRENARRALDRNPSEAATAALVAALDRCGPIFWMGVIGSLAGRKGADVEKALNAAATDTDPQVRLAACRALRNVG